MPFQWSQSPSQVFVNGYQGWATAKRRQILTIFAQREAQIEDWLKTNAPWQDRTGETRALLHADLVNAGGIIGISMAYGNDKWKYLELMHQGRFSILGPAIDHWAPILWADVQGVMA